MTTARNQDNPPADLSPWAQQKWRGLHEESEFSAADELLGEFMVVAFDLAREFLQISKTEGLMKGGKVHPALAGHRDAVQTAIRCWRALKFQDDPEDARRPGRPSGDNWSPRRAAAARAQIASLTKGRGA
jgi:phage terminase small subunit